MEKAKESESITLVDSNLINQLTNLHGDILEVVGPSGKTFIIREQNGEDDELLGSRNFQKNQTNLNLFIQRIVVWTDAFESNKIDSKNIGELLIKDKYFILFQTRIFSIGPDMKFSYDWGDEKGGSFDYTEELPKYLWDYSKPETFPKEGDENFFKFRMKPYEVGHNSYEYFYHTLKSGKNIKFLLTNINIETKLMSKGSDITKNDDLLCRGLELQTEKMGWVKVSNFKSFSKKDMIELHNLIYQLEQPFYGFSEISNPVTDDLEIHPLIIDPAFFFPLEI